MTTATPALGSGDPRPADLRLLGPALAAWVACASLLAVPAPWLLVIGVVCAGGGLLLGRRGRLARGGFVSLLPFSLVACALVVIALAFQVEVRASGTVGELAQQGASVTVQARVASDPQVLPITGVRRTPLVVVRLQISAVTGRGERSRVNSPVLAFADLSWRTLRWGERVEVRGRLGPAERGDDVEATLSGKGSVIERAPPPLLLRGAGRLRSGLQQAVRGTPRDGSQLLPGLVVGDTSRLDPQLEQAMRTSGLTHLTAVSGSNVTIICGTVLFLARWLGLPRRWRAPVAALLLVGFVIVARPEPSVLRAAVMGGIGLIGLASARAAHGVPTLSAAVIGLLVIDPWLARSYGFALSVLATLGLLLFARPWGDWLARWMPRPAAYAVAVPLAAQAVCGPVIVLLQGAVSLISVPANLVVAPLVAPATIAGVVVAGLSVISPAGAHLAAWLGVLPAEGIGGVARLAGRVPMLPWPGGARGAVLLAVVTTAIALGGVPVAKACLRHPWAAAAVVPVLAAGLWPSGGLAWPPPGWVLVMCDVGQGDGVVLNTAPGHAMVVDTGPDPAPMDACLNRLGIHVVDLLLLTHDHTDHAEGVPGVLDGRRVGELVLNGLDDPPAEARRIAAWAAAGHLPVRRAAAGETGAIGAVQWQVLWPSYVIHEGSVPNNDSIVLLVRSRGIRLLLLGDVETPAARQVDIALRAVPGGPHVDVLKVAHHGSALQDPGLIRDADPDLALISVGAGNPYGHPAPNTVNLLRATGATVRRTDQDGDIAAIARDGRLSVVTRQP